MLRELSHPEKELFMRYKTSASWLGGPGILVLLPVLLPLWVMHAVLNAFLKRR